MTVVFAERMPGRALLSPRVNRSRGLLAVALLAGCGTSVTPPESSPTVIRTSGPTATDTIDARPTSPIVLAVKDATGAGVAGTAVVFVAENGEVAEPGAAFGPTVTLMTDSQGQVAASVRFGGTVGSGSIVGTVPTLQIADTFDLAVTPGATVGMSFSPGDTAVVVGDEFPVTALPADRYGNATGAALDITVESGPIVASGSNFVGTSLGVGVLKASSEGLVELATVWVVPDGEVVYTQGDAAWLVRFDGTGKERLNFTVPPVLEPSVDWDQDGARIVVGGHGGFRVFDLLSEAVTPCCWPGGAAGSDVIWPRFGPDDGNTIYYSSSDGAGAWDIRRTMWDGSSPGVVIPSAEYPNDDHMPDWAPDGSAFVFTADWEEDSKFLLRVADPTATSITTIDVEGVTPVWSPDGAWIAYQELGVVGVVAPDGSGNWSCDPGWAKGITWSPASDMLVGISEQDRYIAILDIATGEVLELPHLGSGISAVAWRPEPAQLTVMTAAPSGR
jgi:WD40 repeat protein